MQGPPPDESSWDTRRWNTHPAQGKAGLLPSSPLSPSLLSSAFLDITSSRSDGNRTRKMKSKSKLKVSYCLKMVQLKINNSLIHRGIFCMYYKASQNWQLTANVKQLVFFWLYNKLRYDLPPFFQGYPALHGNCHPFLPSWGFKRVLSLNNYILINTSLTPICWTLNSFRNNHHRNQ